MNFPLQKIHDPRSSYGWLLLPIGRRWLMWSVDHGLRLTFRGGFHNCSRTGVH
jgi:hypothetical protein